MSRALKKDLKIGSRVEGRHQFTGEMIDGNVTALLDTQFILTDAFGHKNFIFYKDNDWKIIED